MSCLLLRDIILKAKGKRQKPKRKSVVSGLGFWSWVFGLWSWSLAPRLRRFHHKGMILVQLHEPIS
jgi:hypothetical protein